jgi:hypothetical protein
MKPDVEAWLKRRGYVHFDRHISSAEVERRVLDPKYVTRHGFMPFIGYDLDEPRYDRAKNQIVSKQRPIRFASHLDSHIFAYYSQSLTKPYEEYLLAHDLTENVLAYRKHPIDGQRKGKCNIHFADEAFEWIKRQGECTAFAFDVEGFFDAIDHQLLKALWAKLLDQSDLPTDHYRVYRAITKYSWVKMGELATAMGFGRNRMEKSREPFTRSRTFREKVAKAGLIRTNSNPFGIPQGSPISALLSNLSMMEFDRQANELTKLWNGYYRRYSDDILVIVPKPFENEPSSAIFDLLTKSTHGTLKLNDKKTVISSFKVKDRHLTTDTPLAYLGFDFDGQRKLIRQKTILRYQRRMVRAVRSAARAARGAAENSGGDGRIWKKDLYERYSHLGRRNFITYAYRCADIMNAPEIRQQTARHWRRLNQLIDEA